MTDIVVLVDSRGGNTRKVAEAIAGALGVTVGDLSAPLPAGAKTLFLGSGTYGGKPGESMKKFIEANDFTGRKVALFGTSGGPPGAEKMIDAMAEDLSKKGAAIAGRFHCRGKFLFTNRGHPNAEDLENAKKFAREMAGVS
ncbi:flavodoxin I [Methanolinea mesophila]|uniref:flavodoxin family protein n=1 Tax=Methanolinea mesophila TaxID=547055 RepID=UPI001AE4D78C|nr:flavodoxin family protein [Methanolinea mesophila]MBP1928969.1 flavodoxin I [Methanolinea mesophila]